MNDPIDSYIDLFKASIMNQFYAALPSTLEETFEQWQKECRDSEERIRLEKAYALVREELFGKHSLS
ncbi:hypothetical protein [Halobacillus sp. KGW1]|uniref:hypothetical protein n=1 Tax=Halobacillus sp. KGW1 TaxID=1793726 RepID=UPI000781629B|nr:hypothetical protein [Halobacillus sp. KGW1]